MTETPTTPELPRPGELHEFTAEMLMEKSGLTRKTLNNHMNLGILARGAIRLRRSMWTRTQVNSWLRKIGLRDRQIEQ